MNQERYWRNLLADEIKAEHDKVKAYYQKRGMNNGGMSNEEHTRLNIFLLCESIARTMQGSQDSPRDISTPDPHKVEIEDSKVEIEDSKIESDKLNSFIEEQIADNQEIPGQQTLDDIKPEPVKPVQDPVRNLVKDTPYQNEFGEIL